MAFMDTTALKNRYENAPRAADFTIDQAWETYSAEEHDRWDRLFRRQKEVTEGAGLRRGAASDVTAGTVSRPAFRTWVGYRTDWKK
jgi:hypothetical protein